MLLPAALLCILLGFFPTFVHVVAGLFNFRAGLLGGCFGFLREVVSSSAGFSGGRVVGVSPCARTEAHCEYGDGGNVKSSHEAPFYRRSCCSLSPRLTHPDDDTVLTSFFSN